MQRHVLHRQAVQVLANRLHLSKVEAHKLSTKADFCSPHLIHSFSASIRDSKAAPLPGSGSEKMKRLFVLGDSITVGYGPFLKEFVNTSTSGMWSYGRKNEGGDGSDMSIYGM